MAFGHAIAFNLGLWPRDRFQLSTFNLGLKAVGHAARTATRSRSTYPTPNPKG
ncbi:MAG: hypothetical protein F6J94_16225 [Moorea sp. SIO1F2]|uniref:hypothetical protein n=1 Tax=Moorena sp. SIO1F2 TaxID=2607819 RepID=UPI0013B94C70|nr:hypothetical protein [Moorena sp. SIO1F2]NET83404.1 hypothetical protein [Moorena sp. SIO1F2]